MSWAHRLRLGGLFLGICAAVWGLPWRPIAAATLSTSYLPHGFCYLWNTRLLALHLVADAVIWAAYMAISSTLLFLVIRYRREIVFGWVFVAFGVFIVSCGFTHLMEIVVLWKPYYWLSGEVKALTAIASLLTACVLPFLVPKAGKLLRESASSRMNEARFLAASNSSNDGFFILESVRDDKNEIVDFTYCFVNENAARLISSTPKGVIGKRICELGAIDQGPGFFNRYKQVVETGVSFTDELCLQDTQIKATWIRRQVIRLNDGLAIAMTNVSDLKESELKTLEALNFNRSLVESSPFAIISVGVDSRIKVLNPAAESMLGYKEADLVGRKTPLLFHETEEIERRAIQLSQELGAKIAPDMSVFSALTDRGLTDDQEWTYVRKDGGRLTVRLVVARMVDADGKRIGELGVAYDITGRKRIELRLEEARQEKMRVEIEAIEASRFERLRLQESFLSHVSHELRTPLTAIYFFITNVLDGLLGDLNTEQQEHLSCALDNVNQLKDMVGDLLDMTRTESNKLSVVPQPSSVARLIFDSVGTCRREASLKGILINTNIPAELPLLWADAARARQVLINVIDNAIKFTPSGGAVTIDVAPVHLGDMQIRIAVTDTGCGIAPENLERVFDRLAQLEDRTGNSRTGLGLGLFIARELVQRHGGRMWVESKVDQGSTFYFTLPVYSLARMLSSSFNTPKTESLVLSLISLYFDVSPGPVRPELLAETRKELTASLRSGQDILLPSTEFDEAEGSALHLITSADPEGVAAMLIRIQEFAAALEARSDARVVVGTQRFAANTFQPLEHQTGEMAERITSAIHRQLVSSQQSHA